MKESVEDGIVAIYPLPGWYTLSSAAANAKLMP